jgi:hypothetical protein
MIILLIYSTLQTFFKLKFFLFANALKSKQGREKFHLKLKRNYIFLLCSFKYVLGTPFTY